MYLDKYTKTNKKYNKRQYARRPQGSVSCFNSTWTEESQPPSSSLPWPCNLVASPNLGTFFSATLWRRDQPARRLALSS